MKKKNKNAENKQRLNYKDEDYVHYLYKITNKINGKYYIGIHSFPKDTGLTPLNDGYWGSGILIRRAIKEEGRENFKKEILKTFSTREELSCAEKQMVTMDEVNNPECYNITVGGDNNFSPEMGGWVICRPKSAIDKVIKLPREEYYKNKELYVTVGHLDYYLNGGKLYNPNNYKTKYKKRLRKLGRKPQKLGENDTLYTRSLKYINKNTLEVKVFIGHDEPNNLYKDWFPIYFMDTVNNKFITLDYFSELYKKFNNLEKIAKFTGTSSKKIRIVRDHYMSLGLNLKELNKSPKGKNVTRGFSDKCFVNKDGKYIVINKSELDKYLSMGYNRGIKTKKELDKNIVLNYYKQGYSLNKTAKHFQTDTFSILQILELDKERRVRWYSKNNKIIRMTVNKEIHDILIKEGWNIGRNG